MSGLFGNRGSSLEKGGVLSRDLLIFLARRGLGLGVLVHDSAPLFQKYVHVKSGNLPAGRQGACGALCSWFAVRQNKNKNPPSQHKYTCAVRADFLSTVPPHIYSFTDSSRDIGCPDYGGCRISTLAETTLPFDYANDDLARTPDQ